MKRKGEIYSLDQIIMVADFVYLLLFPIVTNSLEALDRNQRPNLHKKSQYRDQIHHQIVERGGLALTEGAAGASDLRSKRRLKA
jgi:hypothetical protein